MNLSFQKAFVNDRYYDAIRYELVCDELREIVDEYASEEQKQEAEESEFHTFLMISIIKELLERCRYNRELVRSNF